MGLPSLAGAAGRLGGGGGLGCDAGAATSGAFGVSARLASSGAAQPKLIKVLMLNETRRDRLDISLE
jgi:hypothetical protein